MRLKLFIKVSQWVHRPPDHRSFSLLNKKTFLLMSVFVNLKRKTWLYFWLLKWQRKENIHHPIRKLVHLLVNVWGMVLCQMRNNLCESGRMALRKPLRDEVSDLRNFSLPVSTDVKKESLPDHDHVLQLYFEF